MYWHPRGSSLSDCSFAGANLRYSHLGEWFEGKGNTYRRVSFAGARLKKATTSAATYEDCDFSRAELDRLNFWQSSLVRCKFAGPLPDVVFDGRMLGEGKPTANPMAQIDLTEAVLDGCEFRGVSFDSVFLPPDPALIRIRDSGVVDRAAAALASVPADQQAALAEIALDHTRQLLAMGGEALLNTRELGPAGPLVSRLFETEMNGA